MKTYSFLFFHPTFAQKLHVKWTLDDAIHTTKSDYHCDEPRILAADTGLVDGRPGVLTFMSVGPTRTVATLTTPAGFPGWDDCAINVEGPISSFVSYSQLNAPSGGWRWALIGRW